MIATMRDMAKVAEQSGRLVSLTATQCYTIVEALESSPEPTPCPDCERVWDEHMRKEFGSPGEPGGVPIEVAGKLTVAIERGAYVLAQMMQAYERRIRSECTSQEQIDKRPWECAEYVAAASYLLTMFPQSSTTKPAAEQAAQDMVPRSRYEACNAGWLAEKAAREALSVKSVAWIETLLAALRSAEARLDQPVFNNTEKAGNAAANILRADVASALSVIRTALKYEPPAQPETKEPKHG
jgi:hypothetical protein